MPFTVFLHTTAELLGLIGGSSPPQGDPHQSCLERSGFYKRPTSPAKYLQQQHPASSTASSTSHSPTATKPARASLTTHHATHHPPHRPRRPGLPGVSLPTPNHIFTISNPPPIHRTTKPHAQLPLHDFSPHPPPPTNPRLPSQTASPAPQHTPTTT